MNVNGSAKASEAMRGRFKGEYLPRLRAVALLALLTGAAGSVVLTLRAGQHNNSRFLVVLFVIWVLSPFAALLLVDLVAKRWSVFTQVALYSVMLSVTVCSLAIYGYRVLRPPASQAAFVFVIVPPASWLLMIIVVAIAGLVSGRLPGRGLNP